jgi:hypothetical protein
VSLEHAFPERPLLRRIEKRAGRFISHADGSPHPHGHFEIETMPAPPTGERVLVRDGDEVAEWSEIKSACAHCLAPVTFRFRGRRADGGFIDGLMRGDSERCEQARRAVQMRDEAERAHRLIERHLYAADERDDG